MNPHHNDQQEIFKTRCCTLASFACIATLFVALYSQLIGLPQEESSTKCPRTKDILMQVVHSTP